MDLVTGAMGSLLPKLLELVKDEYNLQTSVKSSIQSLYKELDAMQAALLDVAKLDPDQRDKVLDVWAREVRDLSYDAEDVVDSLPVQVEGSHGGIEGLIPRVAELFSKGKARHEIASAINGIMKQAQNVADRRKRYKVDNRILASPSTSSVDPRLSALYKDPKELVGIEVSRREVIRKLRHGEGEVFKQLKILSIVGIGGLGKTTLAKAVYDKFEADFVCRAFIPVSRNPDFKKVFMGILLEIDKQKYMNYNEAIFSEMQLINEIRQRLADKRYLIVIDDIWDVQSWERIKCALIDSKCGSRVVTTTRISQVAVQAGEAYRLKPLSDKDSEALFNKRLFCGKEEVPTGLPDISKRLLYKCGGVPLAIITMASLLAQKPRNDWSQMYENIGFRTDVGENADVENTRKILLFSYYNLPYDLRACLLHLHIYPEDYLIKKETLIWKWVAEGLIVEKQGIGLFELGETYFMELINSNVIMPAEDDSNRRMIIGCRVHDLVLDMICSESTAENFVVVLDGNKQNPLSEGKARTLAVQNRAAQQNNFLANTSHRRVRSFNATMCHFRSMLSLSRFEALRVLAIEDCTFTQVGPYHLKHIGKLVHLRYLGLYKTPIDKLPEETGDLMYLQTLDLRGTTVKELPQRVGLLRQLKCLRADEGTAVPDWMGNFTSLEELRLDEVGMSVNFVNELGKLRELRELEIWIEELDENKNNALVQSVRNLEKIQVLRLMGASSSGDMTDWGCYVPPTKLRELQITNAFSRLPEWINLSSVPVLSYLHLNVKSMEERDLENLGMLPELVSLKLLMPSNIFPTIKCTNSFPKLRCLDTSTTFRFLETAMPCLESFHFKVDVRALKDANINFNDDSVAFALVNLPSLQKVEVEISSKGARPRPVDAAKEVLRSAVEKHTNSPSLEIKMTEN